MILQTITLLARPELGNLPALACATLATLLHLAAGLARNSRKPRAIRAVRWMLANAIPAR